MQTTETSFNLDGIWGGNMYANAAGAILPNKITSKHNIRYVPEHGRHGPDAENPRATGSQRLQRRRDESDRRRALVHLDRNNEINAAAERMYEVFGTRSRREMAEANHVPDSSETGGYWPSYLFNNGQVGQRVAPLVHMPIGGGAVGLGGRAHAANEFYVIEGAGDTYGMAGAEKSIVTELYNYAGLN